MEKVENIIQAIDQYALLTPQAIAYDGQDGTFTYQQLKQRSDEIATSILEQTLLEGSVIVYGGQSFEMIASFIGCSKAGRAYIPIETHTPYERFQLICEVAQPSMIIMTENFEIKEASEELMIPMIHSSEMNHVTDIAFSPLSLEDTYYIIFTSGTTGIPKGVQISHQNLLSFVNWELSDFGIQAGWRFLSQAPYSFDLSVMTIYPALTSGGTVVPLTKDIFNDFKRLFELLPEMSLDVWVSTPSSMELCLMDPSFNGENLKSIKRFLFCGEELSYQTALKLLDRFPKANIYNTYGPTEATVAVTQVQITKELLEQYSRLPIGYAKEDTEIMIMDDHSVVKNGEVGEIIILGPSVSKGYMNNPSKTSEVFFEFEGRPAYRTGDAGHFDQQGMLCYDGRIDFQVKVHGYRIELEDVDHYLNKVSYIKQAVVIPKYKDHKVQQLVAYVIPEENPFEKNYELTKAIKAELSENVMEYMIPHRFVYVDHLPLTVNGKVDRKSLINEVNSSCI